MATLVFLHGVGYVGHTRSWDDSRQAALDDALVRVGYRAIVAGNVIAPYYGDLLNEHPCKPSAMPHAVGGKLADADHDRERWEYAKRQRSVERLLGAEGGGDAAINLPDPVPQWVAMLVGEARRYLGSEALRGCILQTVLKETPAAGEIVIVGHSLGSLVAIDLLDYLPPEVTVRRLVTLGSPAGHPKLHRATLRLLKAFPLPRVKSWVNVWSLGDYVPFGTGISNLFPNSLDVRINLGMGQHGASKYLANETVATAIGEGLFGSLSTEIVLPPLAIDVPLDENERMIVTALAYGHLLGDQIVKDGRRKQRFFEALDVVQRGLIDGIADFYRANQRAMPSQLAILGDGRRPAPSSLLDVRRSIPAMLAIAATNVVAPYEFGFTSRQLQKAIEKLGQFLGFPQSHGAALFSTLKLARSIVNPGSHAWIAWVVAGSGLLAAGPLGLIVAAPAGLFGGAAFLGALAAFGPGGVLGGLLTAGALASAGGGAMATALVSAAASAETLEDAVVHQLATAIARSRLKEPNDNDQWLAICNLENKITYEIQRLEPYCDANSAGLKILQRKRAAARRALNYIIDNGLILTLRDADDGA